MVQPREIRRYITDDGRIPFADWIDSLQDRKAQIIIRKRLDRFGQIGSTLLLLLIGGDKSTQERDIRQAIEYWKDYRRRENADQ